MKVLQIGNGGGLNPLSTNSSFLVMPDEATDDMILVDCGYNVMQKLIELENDSKIRIATIKTVFITHDDDDHIGSLQTLIYWNYFKNGVVMDVIVHDSIANRLEAVNNLLVDGVVTPTNIVEIITHKGNGAVITKYSLFYIVKGYHGAREAYGVCISNSNSTVFISGDTKANRTIEERVSKVVGDNKALYYHDYSYWDDESKNVHACKTDFNREYSEEFRNKLIKYHTNDPIKIEWVTV